MKQVLIVLGMAFIIACGNNENNHAHDQVSPEDTSHTPYPQGNQPVPESVETSSDSIRSKADSLNHPM